MIHQFETHGKATLVDCATGERHECVSVVTYSSTGAETWLYIEEGTGKLVGAERIDADGWHDMDIEEARREFAEVIYCF